MNAAGTLWGDIGDELAMLFGLECICGTGETTSPTFVAMI